MIVYAIFSYHCYLVDKEASRIELLGDSERRSQIYLPITDFKKLKHPDIYCSPCLVQICTVVIGVIFNVLQFLARRYLNLRFFTVIYVFTHIYVVVHYYYSYIQIHQFVYNPLVFHVGVLVIPLYS